jgi:hypothetical protein
VEFSPLFFWDMDLASLALLMIPFHSSTSAARLSWLDDVVPFPVHIDVNK